MYRAVTRQIEVTVEPNFLPERSSVDQGQYFWSYTIVITNTGARPCSSAPGTGSSPTPPAASRKSAAKAWSASSRAGAGRALRIHRGVPLPTASGFMTGRYQMVSESGERSRSTCRRSRWTARTGSRVLN
jgi:ApaG protein